MTGNKKNLDDIYRQLNELVAGNQKIASVLQDVQDEIFSQTKILDEIFHKLDKASAADLAEEALKDEKPEEAAGIAEAAPRSSGNYEPGMHWDDKRREWVSEKPAHVDGTGQQELEIW
jgi:hypothetical protein